MAQNQPIIIIEDDIDDQDILKSVFEDLGEKREILFFKEGSAALEYLRNTPLQPFIILTDINMPGINGIQLREEIVKDEYLRKKCIPFIFLTTSDGKTIIQRIYELQVQGFFQKEVIYEGIKNQIKQIMDYWKACKHPNSYQ